MHKTVIEKELAEWQLSAVEKLGAEEKLALLAAIVESSEDAIISKNLDGIITSWNEGAQKLFGYTQEETIGMPITILIPVDRLNEETAIIEKLKKGERVEHFETKRRKKDGGLIEISLTISPIRNAQGKVIGASKIARDITQIKSLERRKDDFIHMASHELKTPITSIKGYMQLVTHILSGKDFEAGKDQHPQLDVALTAVNKQVDKMITLISELLDLSRIEFGRLVIRKAPFNLCELVSEILHELRPTTKKHELFLECSYNGDVVGDRDRINQVLVNLLTNAIKYSPEADRVEVTVDAVEGFACIAVRDYGIGVDPANHQLIFDRFYRVEGKDEKTFPGFGIGLYVTSEIVSQHGGRIEVESEKGKGARFIVYIPIGS